MLVLVPGLGRGYQVKLQFVLVLDHSLAKLALAFNDVDQVVYDPVFQAHDHVQVAEADVGVHDDHLVAAHGQGGADVGGRGGLADASLARGQNDGPTLHKVPLWCISRTGPRKAPPGWSGAARKQSRGGVAADLGFFLDGGGATAS